MGKEDRRKRVEILKEMFEAGPNAPSATRLRVYLEDTADIPLIVLPQAIRDARRQSRGPFAPGIGDIHFAARPLLERHRERQKVALCRAERAQMRSLGLGGLREAHEAFLARIGNRPMRDYEQRLDEEYMKAIQAAAGDAA